MKTTTEPCIVQITAGRGPAECGRLVDFLSREFPREARQAGLTATLIDSQKGDYPMTLLSAAFTLKGPGQDAFLSTWRGTLLWVCPSPFRTHHQRKNWFVSLDSFTAPKPMVWSELDLEFQTKRSSGPGGQHANKTESAVRAVHLPTGLAVEISESRSQLRNRKTAADRLRAMVTGQASLEGARQLAKQWTQHTSVIRGNPVRTFRGPKFMER